MGGGHVDMRQIRHELTTAAKLMWATPSLRLMLCTVALMQACFAAMFSLVPLYATTVSDSDHLAQVLYSALGLGALIGALCSSALARRFGRSRVMLALLLGGASAMVLASQMTVAVGAAACAFLFGLCATPAFVLVGGVVQRDAPEQFRGRITSIHVAVVGLVFGIAAPLGGFLADEVWGLRTHLAVSGLAIGATVVVAALTRPALAGLVDGADVRLTRAEQATSPA
jgi:ENTS family enterobactin (siderophore) exporter